MNWHLVLFMGLVCVLIMALSWWHARKRVRDVMLHRVTRKLEHQIAEEIVRTRLRDEVGARAVDNLAQREPSRTSTEQ